MNGQRSGWSPEDRRSMFVQAESRERAHALSTAQAEAEFQETLLIYGNEIEPRAIHSVEQKVLGRKHRISGPRQSKPDSDKG